MTTYLRESSALGIRQITVVTIMLLCVALSSQAYASSRVALVVGNAGYSGSAALANPTRDANAIARVLESIGFDKLVTVNDATRLDFENALDEFHQLSRKADIALFFYAGHAIQWRGGNYMIPVDVTLSSERDIKRLVQLDDVVNDVAAASELGLVILDACRDNPFLANLTDQGTRGFQRAGLAPPSGAAGTLVAFSTQADAVAYDGRGNHSPYTQALLKHLPTPNKDISLVFRAVRDEVAQATDWKQRPFTYGSLGGDEIWLVEEEGAVTPPSAPLRRTPPPGMAFFTVDTHPPDARVRILQPATAYAPGMVLPLGQQYQIMVSRRGFRAKRQTVTIDSNDINLKVSLNSLSGAQGGSSTESVKSSVVSPKVLVEVGQSVNGGGVALSEPLAFNVQQALQSKGITIVRGNTMDVDLNLKVSLFYNITHEKQYGAYNADCSLKYDIVRAADNRLLDTQHRAVQPAGGYSRGEVKSICQQRLLSLFPGRVADKLLAAGSSQRADAEAVQLSVTVKEVGGNDVTGLISIIEALPQVKTVRANGYGNSTLLLDVLYNGAVFDFVNAMLSSGNNTDYSFELSQMNDNKLEVAMSRGQ